MLHWKSPASKCLSIQYIYGLKVGLKDSFVLESLTSRTEKDGLPEVEEEDVSNTMERVIAVLGEQHLDIPRMCG